MMLGRASPGLPSVSSAVRRWDVASQAAFAILALLGLALSVAAHRSLAGGSSTHGQLLGVLLLGLSALGALPVSTTQKGRSSGNSGVGLPAVRIFVMVGLVAAALSTTGLLAQASSEMATHCLLAEAAVRIRHLEERVTAVQHDEMLTQLFFRLNEVDDILDQVHTGAGHHAELKAQQWSLAHQDRDYIRAKVGRLRKHATSVAADLAAQSAKMRAAQGASASAIPGSSERVASSEEELQTYRTLAAMEQRLEGVQQVLAYMDSKDAGEGELTFEEYEIILDALTSAATGAVSGTQLATPPELDKQHLAALKSAFERRQSDRYHESLHPENPHARQLQDVATRRDRARQSFEERFMTTLERHGAPTQPATFYKALSEARLEALPEHCLSDIGGHQGLRLTALAVLAAQGVAAFVALMAASQHIAAAARRFD